MDKENEYFKKLQYAIDSKDPLTMKRISKQLIIAIVCSLVVTIFFQIMSMPLKFAEVFTILLVIFTSIVIINWIIRKFKKEKNDSSE